jgi:hypothetical protein
MGFFAGKGMGKHSASGSGRFLPYVEARYRVKIKRCVAKKGYRGESAIVEFEIVAVLFAPEDSKVKVGEGYSWINKMDKGDVVKGNIADFCRAGAQTLRAQGGEYVPMEEAIPVDEVDNVADEVYGEDNSFADLEIDVHTLPIRTQKDDPFTKHTWRCPEDLLKQLGVTEEEAA